MAVVLSADRVTEALVDLRALSAELYDLGRIAEVLGWDQETMMPPAGVSARAQQQATIQGIYHERLTGPRTRDAIARLRDAADAPFLTDVDRGLIRTMAREFDRAVKVPTALVRELAEATSTAMPAWQQARAEARFSLFRDPLAHILDLKKQVARCVGGPHNLYDTLLDEYEPGASSATLRTLFDALRARTVALLDRLRGSNDPPSRAAIEQHYDVEAQWAFGADVVKWLGFSFDAGRIDRSTHPFCVHFSPEDVRLTTRVASNDLAQLLFGNMHEAGHGLYEQGIGTDVRRSAIGSGVSLGVHESQSRLFENFIGRGLPFWIFALPRLRERFPAQLADATPESIWRAVNVVAPGYIRVEADEVTYNLHIILRFEIERRFFAGDLSVDDLPDAWREASRDLLSIVPAADDLGVLQDIHWAFGLVGYFPTYTLGNVYAAQIWHALGRDLPDRDARIERGEFEPILGWLRERIHRHGGTYEPEDLIARATGERPDARYLGAYLDDKFARVYRLA